MTEVGLSEYCHDINQMDADTLIEQFQALVRNADDVRQMVLRRVETYRRALEEQYELISGTSSTSREPSTQQRLRRNEHRLPNAPRAVGERRHGAAALRRGVEKAHIKASRRIWRRLPTRVRDLHAVQEYGHWLHALISRHADREMYVGTLFLRNRPALELMRRLFAERPQGSSVRVAVLGYSVGVEVYSNLWTLRRARSDLTILVDAVDISPEVLAIAEEGVYGP